MTKMTKTGNTISIFVLPLIFSKYTKSFGYVCSSAFGGLCSKDVHKVRLVSSVICSVSMYRVNSGFVNMQIIRSKNQ
jgi:hypothetical protein